VNVADWREQYERMRRWRWRLWVGVEHIVGGSDEAAIDAFYAFAQTCYHLVDWLENDRSQHLRRPQADAYVAASPALAFCADICNGSKHALLTQRRVRVTSKRTITGSYNYEDESGQMREQQIETTEVFIHWNSEETAVDVFALKCVEEWERVLEAEGLLPAP
jgi:hypothetical protein